MMKAFSKTIPLLVLFANLSAPMQANANACGIWLCLPTGFPSGCEDSKKEFVKRIKDFKSPLPDFSSCLLKDVEHIGSTMTASDGIASVIPYTKIIRGIKCKHEPKSGFWSPRGCTTTIRYVETFMDGHPYGETYYFTDSGDTFNAAGYLIEDAVFNQPSGN